MKVREQGGCNVCNPGLRAAVAQGRDVVFDLDGKNCKYCGAPGRQRALARMLDVAGIPRLRELGLLGRARAICAAPGPGERYLLEPLAVSMLTFSLFGAYGKDHVECDVRDMSRFADASFDLFEASLVLDYVPELEVAIQNVARILARPSVFFIFIHEGRLLTGNEAPNITRTRSRGDGLPTYYPEDYERQQISVGRKWFDAAWRRHGFEVQQVVWRDPSLGNSFTWWIGHRS